MHVQPAPTDDPQHDNVARSRPTFGSTRAQILDRQRTWAGAAADARGYMPSVEENLCQPLSSAAVLAFQEADGGELEEMPHRPAKMRALLSSAALAVNIFDYWTARERHPLQRALSLAEPITGVTFERRFPTGLRGKSPNLDVVLELAGAPPVAIESKFTEWMTPVNPARPAFRPSYFPDGEGLWQSRGLPACQALAEEIHGGTTAFRHLDAPQLLKHVLGLAAAFEAGFALWYVYYDTPGGEGERHRAEVNCFTERVGAELAFRALSYQELLRTLEQCATVHDSNYLEYLRKRYLAAPEPAGMAS